MKTKTMPELSKEEIQEVVKYIKKHIKEKHNCRVGFALREVMGAKYGVENGKTYEKSYHNIEKVGYACIEDSAYTKSTPIEFVKDMSIHKSARSWQQKYWVFIALGSLIIGLLSDTGKEYCKSILLPKDTETKLQSLKKQYNDAKHKNDSLIHEIYLRDSLHKTVVLKVDS